MARAYDDDDKDDDYEDDEEDGQVNCSCHCLWRSCPKHWYLQHFLLFVQQLAVNHVFISPPPHPPTPRHNSKTPKTPKNAEKQRLTPGAWRRG